MDKTPKNKLQEFLARAKSRLPKYDTKMVGSETNVLWKSFLTFEYESNMCFFQSSNSYKTKILAEQDAAERALEWLSKKSIPKKISTTRRIKLFIDIENRATILEKITEKIDIDSFENIFLFCSKSSQKLVDEKKRGSNISIINIPSSSRDVSDIALVFCLGETCLSDSMFNLTDTEKKDDIQKKITYIIITEDHFGDVCCQVAKSLYPNIDIFCTANFEKVIEFALS